MDRVPNWHTPIRTGLYTTSKRTTYTNIWWTNSTRLTRLTTQSTTPLCKDECQGPRQVSDECSSLALQEFCELRAKMYSILLPNGKPKFSAKGVSRRYIMKHLHYKDYLRTLKETESTIASFSTLRSRKQQIKTIELTRNVSAPLTTNVTS